MRSNVPPSKDHDGRSETDAFSNEWVVHLVGGGDVADLIALRLGYVNMGEVLTRALSTGLTSESNDL